MLIEREKIAEVYWNLSENSTPWQAYPNEINR
jgi:hypothetical protein